MRSETGNGVEDSIYHIISPINVRQTLEPQCQSRLLLMTMSLTRMPSRAQRKLHIPVFVTYQNNDAAQS